MGGIPTRIVAALEAYRKVASPNRVNRVGVRYINKILVPLASVRVEDYLKCAYIEIDGLPEQYVNFISRVEYVYDDGARLVLSYGLLSTRRTAWNVFLILMSFGRPER